MLSHSPANNRPCDGLAPPSPIDSVMIGCNDEVVVCRVSSSRGGAGGGNQQISGEVSFCVIQRLESTDFKDRWNASCFSFFFLPASYEKRRRIGDVFLEPQHLKKTIYQPETQADAFWILRPVMRKTKQMGRRSASLSVASLLSFKQAPAQERMRKRRAAGNRLPSRSQLHARLAGH